MSTFSSSRQESRDYDVLEHDNVSYAYENWILVMITMADAVVL